MTIQFSFFLGIYLLALAIFAILAILNIYHIIKYGQGTKGSHLLLTVFLLGTIFILLVSFLLLRNIDFSQTIDVFKNINMTNKASLLEY